MRVSLAGTSQVKPGRPEAFYPELLRRVAALPGVTQASAVNHLPLAGDVWGTGLTIEGEPTPTEGDNEVVTYRTALPGYFGTMGIPILRGRDIALSDDGRAPGVVVINQKLADEHWPGQDPIGKRISTGPDQTWLTIVGVVKDARQHDWAEHLGGEVYLAALQVRRYLDNPGGPFAYMTLVARTSRDPAALAEPIRAAVRDLDPSVTVSDVAPMTSVVARAVSRPRFYLMLLSAFAGLALLLATVGIYGVMSYAVSRRSQELGIRMALGATRRDVLRLVVKGALVLALAGVAVGLVGAVALARLMTGLLYGVTPLDPVTLVGVAFVLAAVAVVASFLPARRATRIDPMTALRND
jgi:putative ABC transport system permease protein